MMKALLIFTLAAFASALPLDEDRQCEGTLCHAGCCPMQGWYCCEGSSSISPKSSSSLSKSPSSSSSSKSSSDNMNCAATAEECPSSSSANYLLRLAKDAW